MIDEQVRKLVCYGLERGLFTERDEIYVTNRILEILQLDEYNCDTVFSDVDLEETLKALLDYAAEKGLTENDITHRDLFDTKLMGALMPRPSEVTNKFKELYAISPKAATDYFYTLSRDSDYIRRYRVAKDIKWLTATPYGELEITINLSKPEKDPKAIAAAKNAPQAGYHRVIPITINGSDWCLQYSPYVYYNEHCIVFNAKHTPMAINRASFKKLLDFVTQFPHYFVGSNADLPIVGGSILSHDHFQGGCYTFAMEKAPIERPIAFRGFEDVEAGIVKWPMSVIRLRCGDDQRLVELADRILTAWRSYTDEAAFVFAETDGEPHNTITPIARVRDGRYQLDLVLRNNITTPEHPLGVYHPHAKLHHIKKENIGLIEVMGLAVLPSRLKQELFDLADMLARGEDLRADETLAKHADWAEELKARYTFTEENAEEILRREVGVVFATVLEHAGVYKCTPEGREAFLRFVQSV